MIKRMARGIVSVNLLSIHTLVVRGREAASSLLTDSYYQWAIKYSTPILAKIAIEDVVDANFVAKVAISVNSTGTVRPNESIALACMVREHKPQTILEIGTCDGISARNMALNAPGATIWTIDLPKENSFASLQHSDKNLIHKRKVGAAYIGTPEESRINQLFGDSALFDFKDLNVKFDLAFIDGSHTYKYVRNDTEVILPLMSEKGLMIWHDCCKMGRNYGVYEYLSNDFGHKVQIIKGTTLAFHKINEEVANT